MRAVRSRRTGKTRGGGLSGAFGKYRLWIFAGLAALVLIPVIGILSLILLSGKVELASASPSDLKLARPTEMLHLVFKGRIARQELEDVLRARNSEGAALGLYVQSEGKPGHFAVKAAATGDGYEIYFASKPFNRLIYAYRGPRKFDVTWPATLPDTLPLHRDALFYGANLNGSKNSVADIPTWIADLGVGFVRLGWGYKNVNPDCLPASDYEHWNWSSLDGQIDAYKDKGVKILLTLLQFQTPSCGNGGSLDPMTILDSPQRYAEYVGAVLRHVTTHYPKTLVAVELGNEPDVDHYWLSRPGHYAYRKGDASSYYDYLQAASDVARKVRALAGADFDILPAGFGGASMDWWKDLLSRPGLKGMVDGFSMHEYPLAGPLSVDQPPAQLSTTYVEAEIAAIRAAGLAQKPVWMTEVGLQGSSSCAWGVSEPVRQQLMREVIDHLARRQDPKIKGMAWFTIQDNFDQRRKFHGPAPIASCFTDQGLGLIDDLGAKRGAFDEYARIIRGKN